jgi:hypothetical protein
MLGLAFYGLAQKRLPQFNGAFIFRIGAGLYPVLNFYKESSGIRDDPVNVLFPSIGAGVSFRWFFYDAYFVDLGVDYLHFFSVDNPPPGYLRPMLGIGIQLK